MNSRIYRGRVLHARLEPVPHSFSYPVYFYGFDLSELPTLSDTVRGFGYNSRALVSIHDKDYLDHAAGTIREKLEKFLAMVPGSSDIARVFLVTCARYFGYVFNPVSFYYCLGPDGLLRCAIAEVNNTFQERHLYLLDKPEYRNGGTRFRAKKCFHVSPFHDMRGEYEFQFSPPEPIIDIRVDLVRDGRVVFRSQIAGKAFPLDTNHLIGTLARHPIVAAMTMPRIMTQAAHLYVRKRLPVFTKPAPSSPLTIRTAPATAFERACARIVTGLFERLEAGKLSVRFPDGSLRVFGGARPGFNADMLINQPSFFSRVVLEGEIGLGDAYVLGEWNTENIASVIGLFIENREQLQHGNLRTARLATWLNRLRHVLRKNSLIGSRKNISAHYDLSNDFFKLWLDPTMMYSAAYFERPDQSLEEAQRAKIRKLIQAARIGPNHHVLEIGSGWGGFAIEAVRLTGCRVTSITISERQLEEARNRARAAGLDDRIEFRLCDYRRIEGRFDRIVSIEMLEAVGREYFGAFFETLDRALQPNGVIALQVITIPDQRYRDYCRSTDWIQQRIFPGGHLPALSALLNAMARHSSLHIESVENIGPHYAPTLRRWAENFEAHRDEIQALGFDDAFLRKWRYYLGYCEAAFATRALDDLQIVLTRACNPSLRLAYR